jgi:hypothetical protein
VAATKSMAPQPSAGCGGNSAQGKPSCAPPSGRAPTGVSVSAPSGSQGEAGDGVTGVVRYCPLVGQLGTSSVEPMVPPKATRYRKAA